MDTPVRNKVLSFVCFGGDREFWDTCGYWQCDSVTGDTAHVATGRVTEGCTARAILGVHPGLSPGGNV